MKNIKILSVALFSVALCSCNDFLTREPLATQKLSEYFVNDSAAISVVLAAYVPAQWQLQETYFNEWFIGDIASDDALKGGLDISDMSNALQMENFEVSANNEMLKSFYAANFQGIFRCNFAMQQIDEMSTSALKDDKLRARLIAESKFLRA